MHIFSLFDASRSPLLAKFLKITLSGDFHLEVDTTEYTLFTQRVDTPRHQKWQRYTKKQRQERKGIIPRVKKNFQKKCIISWHTQKWLSTVEEMQLQMQQQLQMGWRSLLCFRLHFNFISYQLIISQSLLRLTFLLISKFVVTKTLVTGLIYQTRAWPLFFLKKKSSAISQLNFPKKWSTSRFKSNRCVSLSIITT